MNYLPRGKWRGRPAALAAAGTVLLAACSGTAGASATGTIPPASGPTAAGFPGTAGSPSVLPTSAQPSTSPMPMPTSASPAPAGRPVASNAVTIRNFAFGPQIVTVKAGTTVRWTNRDADAHTVTSDTGVFRSAVLQPGASYSYTFRTPGTYSYHCSIHPFMTGKLVVS